MYLHNNACQQRSDIPVSTPIGVQLDKYRGIWKEQKNNKLKIAISILESIVSISFKNRNNQMVRTNENESLNKIVTLL